ncbi:MAG: DUF4445 domain-containing protein [Candidatus Omnitrophica bacterium]|nr:DUF4445 domain-containing protein [Candidatus Omnitrophota bacterium]
MLSNISLLLDIGTTTISGAILNKPKKRLLASDSILNGQAGIADDVISRIDFALKNSINATQLQKLVASSINSLISRLVAQSGKEIKDIDSAYCVSNTAMHHLFLGIDPSPLVTPPYKAAQKAEMRVYAERVSLKLRKGTPVTFLPNIGSFIGSDALSVILASEIYKSSSAKLAIDIGTNGEVMLGNKDKILVASTAAGPAFEGRHISCGMMAKEGAIESIKLRKNRIEFKVIGKSAPKGLSGSGLIDAAAVMLKCGAMDKSGKMDNAEFVIYKRGKSKISMKQADIRKIQLAKGAVYAAIKVLLRRYNISEPGIGRIYITGSFGNTIDVNSLMEIGLIPRVDKRKVSFLKKGALQGLYLYVVNPGVHKNLLSILSKIRHIPLLGRGFSEDFTSSLFMG